jgi:hypothetical protein
VDDAAVTQKVIKQGPGLWLEAGTLESPPGALRQADDVLLHRPGLIVPRFGLGVASEIATRTTTYRPVKLVPFGTDLVVSSYLSGTGYRLERGTVNTAYVTGAGGAPPASGYETTAFEARQSLYLTTDTGIRKLTSAAATIANAGLDVFYAFPTVTQVSVGAAATKYAIPATGAVAYRLVIASEDANGYIRRSAPSERYVASNSTADRMLVRFDRIYLPSWIAAGDIVEIYRTVAVTPQTAIPDTEYQLAITHTVTSAEVTAGYITEDTVEDDVLDASLGAFLYTNPSQGGIGQANDFPPHSRVCAWWNGCAWYGYTTDRHRLVFDVAAIYAASDSQYDTIGLHASALTGDFSSGSAIIQNASRVDGLMIGQYVGDASSTPINAPTQAGTYVPAETQITKVETRLTFILVPTAGRTIVIAGRTFTWVAGAPANDAEINQGASAQAALTNFVTAVNNLALTSWQYTIDPLAVDAGGTVCTINEQLAGHGIEASGTSISLADITLEYRLTMDANASATNATTSLSVHDWIAVNGTTFYMSGTGTDFSRNSGSVHRDNPTYRLIEIGSNVAETARNIGRAVSAYTRLVSNTFATYGYRDTAQGDDRRDGSVLLQRGIGTLTAITVQTLRTNALRPNATTSLESEAGARSNRIAWSKIEEPEAVRLLAFADVGSRSASILALTPLADALLVWTTRGLYRLTGSPPDGWRIDPLDDQLRLLHPECTTVCRGICYAWTDRGMVAVASEGGIELVSGPIGPALRDAQRTLYAGITGDNRGYYCASHERRGLVILALASAAGQTTASEWYVYHVGPRTWARWSREDRCAVYSSGKDGLRTASSLAHWSILGERSASELYGSIAAAASSICDVSLAALSCSVASSVVTIATSGFTPHTPQIGDVLSIGGGYYRVTATDTSGANTLLTVDGSPSGSTATWYQRITSTLIWHPVTVGSSGIGAHWQEMQLALEAHSSLVSPVPLAVGGVTHLSSGASTVTPTVSAGVEYTRPVRVGLPRELARSPHFAPYVQFRTAGTYWQLGPMTLDYREVGRLVAQ